MFIEYHMLIKLLHDQGKYYLESCKYFVPEKLRTLRKSMCLYRFSSYQWKIHFSGVHIHTKKKVFFDFLMSIYVTIYTKHKEPTSK